ncbi:flagellar biosynthetic protein FliR [Aestuariibacter sp. AA17]|uniref:Flagellar biosynthetic protein FliR n=1 Tax=Fluctibacter corallii TaxID=2984329 RepID=A0ABT3A9H5_9ALTE|nr:flagellar biosynthetic protein FliR [Aestuariibacter sp. AA17]MCV2885326.1 flagellar biosynthetic protein FliR [Aestuariibacter sp. AA17]
MEAEVKQFALMLSRFGVMFWIPLTGPLARIPLTVRAFTVMTLVLCLYVLARENANITLSTENTIAFIPAMLFEFLFGLLGAVVLSIPAVALLFFGRVMDMQLGLGAAAILNPATNSQDSLIGSALVFCILVLFWALNLHLDIIQILFELVKLFPLGSNLLFATEGILAYLSTTFLIGFYLSFPVIAALFAVDVASGIVSKNMPQMNVYFVLIPAKILVGLVVLSLTVKALANHMHDLAFAPVKFFWGL